MRFRTTSGLTAQGVKDVGFLVPDAFLWHSSARLSVERKSAHGTDCDRERQRPHGDRDPSRLTAKRSTRSSSWRETDPRFEPRVDSIARSTGLHAIDHVVANVELGKMNEWVDFYDRIFSFTMLKHFDDDAISTEYTALMSKVMAGGNGIIKLPINEPAQGKKKSQIEEYLDFYGSPGVQHLALSTSDLLVSIEDIHGRGIETIYVPHEYYPEARGSSCRC